MSKGLKVTINVDENVTSVAHCRNSANIAENEQKRLKEELWGLVMATPKDITPDDEEPMSWIRESFEEIWEGLWDAFVDNYKYTVIADDVEYGVDSTVQKQWDEEIAEMEKLREENRERDEFFQKYCDVVNKYNIDDLILYGMLKEGSVELPQPFNKETKEELLTFIKENDEKQLREAMEKVENG